MSTTYYTVKEVSDRFRVTPATVINWIKTGYLPAVQIGGIYRITEEQIQEAIKNNKKAE